MAKEPDYVAQFERVFARLQTMAETDPQLGAAVPDEKVTTAMQAPGLSYQQIIATALAGYANRPGLGIRAYEIRNGERHYLPAFTTISYGDLAGHAQSIASVWRHDRRFRVNPGEFVSYLSFTGAEMTAIDFACVYNQAVGVPLQANQGSADVLEILRDVGPVTMIASIDHLALATDYALQQPTFRSMIVIDADERVDPERDMIDAARVRLSAGGRGIAIATFAQIVEAGRGYEWAPLPPRADGRESLSMLMYTSGSTGTPKGAMIDEAMCIQFWSELRRYQPTIAVACAPMNHVLGRAQIFPTLAQGGTCYFSLKSDLSTLLDDIRIARPTFNIFLPRFAELIYHNYLSEVQRRIGIGIEPDSADEQVRREMRASYLGDRLLSGAIGGSPTAPEVQQFLRDCFNIALLESYGSTEAGGAATTSADRVRRDVVLDYKLRDVPELGYCTTDKPFPRGELLVKTRFNFKGYFKQPEATAKVFDEKGFLITGDIVEEREPDHLVWLDRRNNVIKLSQAEYVAIGPLESAYLADNPLVSQIYVYGSSYRAFLLAVVVPDVDYARNQIGHDPSDEELRVLVKERLQMRAQLAGLKSFEIPRDVLIERAPFSVENGLLSSIRKPLRPNLKLRYGDRLEAMYHDMDRKQHEELARLRVQVSGISTIDRVSGALKANLGLANVDPGNPQSYRDLGGDSLGAVGLSILLEEMFAVAVPVSEILNPAGSAVRLAQYIDRASAADSSPGFASVHGGDATSLHAQDLVLPAFFDHVTLAAAAAARPATAETGTVLITGATGFLGRFLCLEWMEALAPKGGKVIAIVRASDSATARARLEHAVGTMDAELTSRYLALAGKHLEVIAGDLALTNLSQSEANFARLAREVDQIVHSGALVNHRLSYQNLFEPNVIGTAELIRLALSDRQKRFDYVSTIGVPYNIPALRDASEDADVRIEGAEVALADEYARGYAASKWAGEVLLREAYDCFGLSVNVFRPNMIMAHSRYAGQINVPDLFTRLLFSLVTTGIAPESFYGPEADGSRARAHYDGMPVDVLAAALCGLGQQVHDGFRTFNCVNSHYNDAISLDSFVDWIVSAGYPLRRAKHAEWARRFGYALRRLPEKERQRSSLNILNHLVKLHSAKSPRVSSARFDMALRELPAGGGVPHLSEAFIHKNLKDMQVLGLIPAPATAPVSNVALGAHSQPIANA